MPQISKANELSHDLKSQPPPKSYLKMSPQNDYHYTHICYIARKTKKSFGTRNFCGEIIFKAILSHHITIKVNLTIRNRFSRAISSHQIYF